MKSLWKEAEAKTCSGDLVELRAYSSRLMGANPDLVLHGGGNTSVKAEWQDVFGEKTKALFVKGSGWDLRTIAAAGFPPTRLDYLLRLGELDELGDSAMMRELRLALLDPAGPTPSVEAILHALIPHRFVDHSHADAVVTLSNTPDGEAILQEIYGSEVLILPYIMPGFILARQVAAATANLNWAEIRGIVLMHHGIFTFAEDARDSYETMIELVSKAEQYLEKKADGAVASEAPNFTSADLLELSKLRKAAGELYGGPVILRLDTNPLAAGFAARENAAELIQRGPLTPDHTIHAKAFGAVIEDDVVTAMQDFDKTYQDYFQQHSGEEHRMLDTMPRYGVWLGKGMVYIAPTLKRLQIVADISAHTIKAIQQGEALGGWQALPRADLFDVEYWELEQAKLKNNADRAEFEGRVALVSGAASGIGRASAQALLDRGAAVIALDIQELADDLLEHPALLPVQCDVTSTDQLSAALEQALQHFGGIDLVVSNAGSFPASSTIEELKDQDWEQTLALNLGSHMKLLRACIPFLKNGFDPAVVVVGSKNVPAPGPGAGAYSAAKAGLSQLARVAALELGQHGIRINTIHPNAVYDTAIWNEQVLASRAAHYKLSVEEYKTRNLLRTELKSADVAAVITALLGRDFSKTTAAQIPVDGGNERVI